MRSELRARRAKLLYSIGAHRQIYETYCQVAARRRELTESPRYDEALPKYSSVNLGGQKLMLDLGADISTARRELEHPVPGEESTG